MRNRSLLTISLFILLYGIMTAQTLKSLLPFPTGPWTTSSDPRHFTGEQLYEYIDGGAELFLSYNYREAVSQKYVSDNEPEVVADIFDMGTAANAYGVFCHTREKQTEEFGQGAQVYEDAIIFWKDRYYVSLMAYDLSEKATEFLHQLASSIDSGIPGEGPLPEILKILPEQYLDYNSVLYFHHYIWQNNLGYLTGENLLNISDHTDAVLAKYRDNDQTASVLAIKYPDEAGATTALAAFQEQFEFEDDSYPVRIEDQTWWAASGYGRYFLLVFAGTDKDFATSLLNQLKSRCHE